MKCSLFILVFINFSLFLASSKELKKGIKVATNHSSTDETDELKSLIVKATSWFPKTDLTTKGYQVFNQKVKKRGTVYSNKQRPTWRLKTESKDSNSAVVFIDKHESESKEPLNSRVFVVLIKSANHQSLYTAHKAYVRDFEGEKSVEWDLYGEGNVYENILTAFVPSDFIESRPVMKNTTEANMDHDKTTKETFSHKEERKNKADFSHSSETWEKEAIRSKSSQKEDSDEEMEENNSFSTTARAPRKITKKSKFVYSSESKKPETYKTKLHKFSESPKNKNYKEEYPVRTTTASSLSSESESDEAESEERNKASKEEAGHDSVEIKYVCPKGSGAIVVGNICKCPPPTKLHNNKCIPKQNKDNEQKNFDSKPKERTGKKCPNKHNKQKGRKCKKENKEIQDFLGVSSSEETEDKETIKLNSSLKSDKNSSFCREKSGAIWKNHHCVCPKSMQYNKEKTKCLRKSLKKPAYSFTEKPKKTTTEKTKTYSWSSSTTTDSTTTETDDDSQTTTTADPPSSTTTEIVTSEPNIPYISEDEIPPTKTNREMSSEESQSSEQEDLDEGSSSSNPFEETGKRFKEMGLSTTTEGTSRELTLEIEGAKSTTMSKSPRPLRFVCPKESGAFLKGDRCFCPKGMFLRKRKCIPKKEAAIQNVKKTKTSTTTEMPYPQLDNPYQAEGLDRVDIIVLNNLRKRDAAMDAASASSYTRMDTKNNKKWNKQKERKRKWESSSESSDHHFKADSSSHTSSEEEEENSKDDLKMADLRLSLDLYSIGNDKATGHPLFESTKAPYTGILNCKFLEKKVKDFDEPLEKAVVDYYLHTLRAQCYPNIRKNTLKLFNSGILSIYKTNYTEIQLNNRAKLMNQRILNGQEWQNYISAIFLSKFSEAFSSAKSKSANSMQLNAKRISESVRTLTLFVEKTLGLLERKQFKRNAVKIICALESVVGEWTHRAHRLVLVLNIFCRACENEREINEGDIQHLILLNEYIKHQAPNIVKGQTSTFKQFYENKDL